MTRFTYLDIVHHLLVGMGWTVGLSVGAFILGGSVGLLILFARISPNPFLQRASKVYIEFFQGTPLLMHLFLLFFGLPLLDFDI